MSVSCYRESFQSLAHNMTAHCWHRGAGPERLLLSPAAQEGSPDREPSGPSVDRAKVQKFCLNLIQTPSLLCSELMGSHITSNPIQTPAAAAHRALGDLGPAGLSDLSLPTLPLLTQPDCSPYLSPTMQDFPHLRVLASAAPTIQNTLLRASPLTFLRPPGPSVTA